MRFNFILKIVLLLFLAGCSDDFLRLKPIAMETEETFYTTVEGIEQGLIACYSQLCIKHTWDKFYLMTLGSIASDDAEAGGSDAEDTPPVQHVGRMIHTPAETQIFEYLWGYPYKGIYFCNVVIEKIALLKETDPTIDPAYLAKRLGEAKFLRAFYYFTLTQVFGGVPLVDKVINPEEAKKGRSSIKEIYTLIEEDLKYAIEVLPEKDQVDDVGRISKGAALALMAKMLLFESSYAKNYPGDERFKGMWQRWGESLDFAERVIESKKYQLVGIDGESFHTWWNHQSNGFRYIFTLEGDNSDESVFEIQNIQDGKGWTLTRGTYMTMFTTPRWYFKNNSKTLYDSTSYGWGFNCPTQDLAAEFEPGDPRFSTSISKVGDSILLCPNTRTGEVQWHRICFVQSPTKMYCRKYECSYEQYWKGKGDWQEGPMNLRMIRYADVVLWAAEAALEMGDNEKAREYLNQVRTRARVCGNSGKPEDIDRPVVLEDIIHERRVELALEGHRFFDLVRWNLATEHLNRSLEDGFEVIFTPVKNDFYPIPEKEIGLSGNKLEQYTGW